MSKILKLILMTIGILAASQILPGVHVDSYLTAIVVAIVLGVLNMFVRPILVFFTLPLTIISLGLFILVINVGLVLLTDYLVPGLTIDSWVWALGLSLTLWLMSWFFEAIVKE